MLDKFLVMHDAVLFMSFSDTCKDNSFKENHTNNHISVQSLDCTEDVLDCIVKASCYSLPLCRSTCNTGILKNICSLHMYSHSDDNQCKTTNKRNAMEHGNILKLCMDGYLLSVFVKVLKMSMCYRNIVIAHFKSFTQLKGSKGTSLRVVIQLKYPLQDIIDYAWNERMERLSIERRELDNAMSWLSTLGGAFSALGDQFDHCVSTTNQYNTWDRKAEMAGLISVHQLHIAMRLGDPLTVARCKLYLALSTMQRGYLLRARRIIEQQYQLAYSTSVVDTRLVRMCLGIWAKLKYMYQVRQAARQIK